MKEYRLQQFQAFGNQFCTGFEKKSGEERLFQGMCGSWAIIF